MSFFEEPKTKVDKQTGSDDIELTALEKQFVQQSQELGQMLDNQLLEINRERRRLKQIYESMQEDMASKKEFNNLRKAYSNKFLEELAQLKSINKKNWRWRWFAVVSFMLSMGWWGFYLIMLVVSRIN